MPHIRLALQGRRIPKDCERGSLELTKANQLLRPIINMLYVWPRHAAKEDTLSRV